MNKPFREFRYLAVSQSGRRSCPRIWLSPIKPKRCQHLGKCTRPFFRLSSSNRYSPHLQNAMELKSRHKSNALSALHSYQGCTMCHVKLETSACHEILSDVIGRTSCPSPWSDKGLKPLVQHWNPWKLLTGHGNFAFYHPLLTYNTLHHVGSVLQALKAFLSCSKVEGLTSPLSAAIPWSSEQMCKFSARFDGCNRILAAFWHGRELESDTSMRKSNHPVKTLNFGMSSDSLWCFFQEQAAHGPGLTKD